MTTKVEGSVPVSAAASAPTASGAVPGKLTEHAPAEEDPTNEMKKTKAVEVKEQHPLQPVPLPSPPPPPIHQEQLVVGASDAGDASGFSGASSSSLKPCPSTEEEDPNTKHSISPGASAAANLNEHAPPTQAETTNTKTAEVVYDLEEQHPQQQPPIVSPPSESLLRASLHAAETAGGGDNVEDEDSSAFISVSFSNHNDDAAFRKRKQQEQEERLTNRLRDQLNQQDKTKAVRITRMIVLLFLCATAAVVSIGVYLYATHKEQQDFETAFEIHASQLLDSFSNTMERRLVAFGTLANTITNYVQGSKDVEWPFVTVPNFEVLGADFRVQGGNAIVHFMPMITPKDRVGWEAYALQHRFQIDSSFKRDKAFRETQDTIYMHHQQRKKQEVEGGGDKRSLQQEETATEAEEEEIVSKEDGYNVTIVNPYNTNETETVEVIDNVLQDGTEYRPKIFASTGVAGDPVVMDMDLPAVFPVWQRSPVNGARQATLNLNMMAGFTLRGVQPQLLQDPGKVYVNRAIILPKDSERNFFGKNLVLSQYRHDLEDYGWDPISFAAYPIFDDFFNVSESVQHHRAHLKGILVTNFYWRLYFQNILPPDVQGIICVLRNSFNQTFSYQIDGPKVNFLGEIDPIELYERYQHMGIDVDATSYVQERARPDTRPYTTVPLSSTFGVYTLHVYPSRDTKRQYTSNQPFLFCWVIAAVFFFTVLVFLLFDWLVERRQRILMDRAIQSGALVSSLFPEQVQDRLYQERGALTTTGTKQGSGSGTGIAGIGTKLDDPITRALGASTASAWKVAGAVLTNSNRSITDDGGQIADVYNDTVCVWACCCSRAPYGLASRSLADSRCWLPSS